MSQSDQKPEAPDLSGSLQGESLRSDAAIRAAMAPPTILPREIIGVLLLIAASDVSLYRSHGFAGPAAFFSLAPILIWLGTVRRMYQSSQWILILMLLGVIARLLSCGSVLAFVAGCIVLCCFAMSLAGIPPYITWAMAFASRLVAAGLRGLKAYAHALSRYSPAFPKTGWFSVAMPVVTLLVFGSIFVLANPDLVRSFGTGLTRLVEFLEHWVNQFDMAEGIFCLGAGWLAVGLLRPEFPVQESEEARARTPGRVVSSPLYEGYRNTLLVVIGLFAVYLIFEVQTLWFRSFPKGFYYSGYAHEGAAWLTVALGLATVLLSLMFRGTILNDPRCARLRAFSWIWSLENLLLGISVFNRLSIYVGFNGMTRMRVVGFLGVASVVVGFGLVLVKIARDRDFTWLIRRQLWAVSIAVYVYAVFPVDAYVNSFNVQKILAGDPAPSVQISVHPTSDEGYLCLPKLLDCSDETIREGVRAMLINRLTALEDELLPQYAGDWTTTQLASSRLRERLRAIRPELDTGSSDRQRLETIDRFYRYAYQWY